jgi:predicted RNA-binding Zn ribbon-like protein
MKFLFGSGRLCLDFVRTARVRRGNTIEGLTSKTDLIRWASEANAGIVLLPQHLSMDAPRRARDLREAVYALVQDRRCGRSSSSTVRKIINEWAAHQTAVVQLAPNCKRRLTAARKPFMALLASIARDAIELVTSKAMDRVRECADEECTSLFVDTSRPGKRVWCSVMPCANRYKVRAYRARRGKNKRPRRRSATTHA